MSTNFNPTFQLNLWQPSKDEICSMLYELMDYLNVNPIPTDDELAYQINQYFATHPVSAPVTSVCEKTGNVLLQAIDIDYDGNWNVKEVLDGQNQILESHSQALEGVYKPTNPPPYPVTSVNGQTGDVVIQGTTAGGAVDSVNGKTGVVTLTASDIDYNASYTVQTVIDGINTNLNAKYSQVNPPPYPVTSVNGQTGDVQIDVSGSGTAFPYVAAGLVPGGTMSCPMNGIYMYKVSFNIQMPDTGLEYLTLCEGLPALAVWGMVFTQNTAAHNYMCYVDETAHTINMRITASASATITVDGYLTLFVATPFTTLFNPTASAD